jgi:hypothetical protein
MQPTRLPLQQSAAEATCSRLGTEIVMRAIGFMLHDLLFSGN